MATTKLTEVWLRGPLPSIPLHLQPVAHALLQAREEVNELMKDFPDDLLWQKPSDVASPGFHLQHLHGVLDRLFSYADGKQLTEEQLSALKAEGNPETTATTSQLVKAFNEQVDIAINELEQMDEEELLEPRSVGRAQLPSTVLGLLFHAAEHTMRHVGQLLVTARVLKDQSKT